MDGQGLLLLIDIKVLVMMTSLQKVSFQVSSPPDVDGISLLIKIIRPQNIVFLLVIFCGLVVFMKNFDPINIRMP